MVPKSDHSKFISTLFRAAFYKQINLIHCDKTKIRTTY